MPVLALDADTRQLLVKRVLFMLNALREAEELERHGFESTSWRGQLCGFKCAIEVVFGFEATNEIFEVIREEARRNFGERLGDVLMKRGFPQAERAHDEMRQGYIYVALGEHERALAEGLTALEQNPTSARRYAFIIGCYILLHRLKEGRAYVDEADRKNIHSPGLHFCSYLLAFLSRDAAEMERHVAWGMGKPGVEDVLLSLEANTQAFFGRLNAARDFSRRAVSSSEQLGEKELAARYLVDAALREAFFGNEVEAERHAESALILSNGRGVKYKVALALAFAGYVAKAQSLIDDFDMSVTEDTVVQSNYLPTLNAKLALSHNDPQKAIEALHAATSQELANVGKTALYPIFVRGEAFLNAHQGEEAAAEFQKILDHPGIVLNGPIGIRGRLGLAQAYVLQKNTAKAKLQYQEFFELWKDADPDIPILIAAKAEYAKLQ
jgi:tetratricopeptide (TPR) repeat protein